MSTEYKDEILEMIWLFYEEFPSSILNLKDFEKIVEDFTHTFIDECKIDCLADILKEMDATGLIAIKDDNIKLTEKGELNARNLIRRHRLAETLLMDIFDLSIHEAEQGACKFEHILSEKVTDSICTLLGHPPYCPHGKPIPRGSCCQKFLTEIKSVVIPLTRLKLGTRGKILFITSNKTPMLQKITNLGILPGIHIKLLQKKPAIIIQTEESNIAIDEDIASEIFVRED